MPCDQCWQRAIAGSRNAIDIIVIPQIRGHLSAKWCVQALQLAPTASDSLLILVMIAPGQ
jgi:hypothetical protein